MKILEHFQNHTASSSQPLTATTTNDALIKHIIATKESLAEIAPTSIYEYVYGSNGTFVRAKRQGLIGEFHRRKREPSEPPRPWR